MMNEWMANIQYGHQPHQKSKTKWKRKVSANLHNNIIHVKKYDDDPNIEAWKQKWITI